MSDHGDYGKAERGESPDTAPPDATAGVLKRMAPILKARRDLAEQAAKRLGIGG